MEIPQFPCKDDRRVTLLRLTHIKNVWKNFKLVQIRLKNDLNINITNTYLRFNGTA